MRLPLEKGAVRFGKRVTGLDYRTNERNTEVCLGLDDGSEVLGDVSGLRVHHLCRQKALTRQHTTVARPP